MFSAMNVTSAMMVQFGALCAIAIYLLTLLVTAQETAP